MKKLGIVGGIGPESTVIYYNEIIRKFRDQTGHHDYPPMVIDSLNLAEIYDLVANKDWDAFSGRFIDSINRLTNSGAQLAVMAANTAHIVFERVQAASSVPLISIVEETCKYAKDHGCQRAVILGTAFTMSSGLFTDAFAKHGMEAFVPSNEEQQIIHGIIFPNLQEGIVLPEEKAIMLDIARKNLAKTNADTLVLGCTELPLIIKDGDLDTILIDTTQVHIDAIVSALLAS